MKITIKIIITKQYHLQIKLLEKEGDNKEYIPCILFDGNFIHICQEEKENVLATIPLVQCDSILGWEHSMEYVGDEPCLRWKLRQLDYELNCNLKDYRTANSLVDIYENKE